MNVASESSTSTTPFPFGTPSGPTHHVMPTPVRPGLSGGDHWRCPAPIGLSPLMLAPSIRLTWFGFEGFHTAAATRPGSVGGWGDAMMIMVSFTVDGGGLRGGLRAIGPVPHGDAVIASHVARAS